MTNGIDINSLQGNLRNLATSIDGGKDKKADGFINPDDLLDETPVSIAKKIKDAGYKDIASAKKALESLGISVNKDGLIYTELETLYRENTSGIESIIKSIGEKKKYGGIEVEVNRDFGQTNSGYIYYRITGSKFSGGTNVMLSISYENGKIDKINTFASPEKMAVVLKLFGTKELPLLKEISTHLKLPEVTNQMLDKIIPEIEQMKVLGKIQAEEGRWIIKNGKLERTSEIRESMSDISGTNEVGQGQYGIGKFGVSASQYIQTHGAGPCVILTLYDPVTKTGLIAHIDEAKDVKTSMQGLINKLKQIGVNQENLQARVIGGNTGASEETILDIYNTLSDNKIPIIEKDILGYGSRAIMLDTETGKVYDYTESIHDTSEKEMSVIVMQTQISSVLTFNNK